MCLIDTVRRYDESSIDCATRTHQAKDNPLRADGRLGAICGVEYAAQAAAIHSGLLNASSGRKPKSGYLAAIRGVQLGAQRLDDIDVELEIAAKQVLLDETSCIYEFTIKARERELLRGRLTVVQNF